MRNQEAAMSQTIARDTVPHASPAPKPGLLDVVRQTARRQGHSEQTITAFVSWVTIFVRFHARRHPRELQLEDVAQFLEQLGKTARDPLVAIEEARIALEFLYDDVLCRDLGELPRPVVKHPVRTFTAGWISDDESVRKIEPAFNPATEVCMKSRDDTRFCDGISRRSFLRIGALGMGGLSLPGLLQAEERAGRSSHKAVIMVYLSGGLSHHDSFDLKPLAPREIAGEFRPIATRVTGIHIGEHLPRLAGMMDKLAIVRSIVGLRDEHSSFQTLTGYTMNTARREGKPNSGSVIGRVLGRTSPIVPAFVDLFPTMQHRPYNIPGPGYAGPAFAGAKVEGDSLAAMRLRDLSLVQFQDRRRLLRGVDGIRRTLDNLPVERMDISYRQAFEVLTSRRLVDALDLDKEPRSVRDRYGHGSPRHQGDGAPLWNDPVPYCPPVD
jgi:hypothetical protein